MAGGGREGCVAVVANARRSLGDSRKASRGSEDARNVERRGRPSEKPELGVGCSEVSRVMAGGDCKAGGRWPRGSGWC